MLSTFSSMVISDLSCGSRSFNVWSMIICGFMVYLIANYSRNLETRCKVIRIMLRFHVKSLTRQVNSEILLLSLQGWGHTWNAFVVLKIPLLSIMTLKMLMTTLQLWQHQARTFSTAYLHSRTFTIACLHFWCLTYKSCESRRTQMQEILNLL